MGRRRRSFDFDCMDVMPVVLDISSDDETGLETLADSFDWLKEFLGVSDEEGYDSDDVAIVGEVKANPKKNPETVEDQDDDCVVLDGDPDKSISAGEEPDDASNEIVVVGQKGEIACRDYPHPRHHCARFPFASTPHEKHCHQCHCYVCDSLAPCLYWGTGISKSDHCHGTDKTEMWKVLRRDFKHGSDASSPTVKPSGTENEIAPMHANQDFLDQNVVVPPNSTLQNQISDSISTLPVQPLPNSVPPNQSSMEPITCAYLSRLNTSTVDLSTFSVHASHPINNGQNQVSGGLLERSRCTNPLIQNQVFRSSTRRDPGHVTRIGPQCHPTSVMLKKPRTNGINVRRVAGFAYNSLNSHLDSTTQNVGNTLSGASNRCQSSQSSSIRVCAKLPSYKFTDHPNLGRNRVPPESCNPSVIQSNSGQECYHLENGDNRFQCINNYHDDGGFGNINPQQDGSGYHSINMQANQHPVSTGFPSTNQQVNKYYDDVVFHGINQYQNDGEFQGIIQEENEYHIIPNDTYHPESLYMTIDKIEQQGNLHQNAKGLVSDEGIQSQSLQITDYSANAFRCVNNPIQSDCHPAESFQGQHKVGYSNEPPSVPESISPYSGNAIDLEFEKWLSESQSPLLSPETLPTDVGMLSYDLSYSCEM